jgi:antitoxin (DNA-binding transcriptional repressor) of toxin-antitoxin stability system
MSKHTMVYSATDANRHFSKILKRVENGETILITSRRKVIAEMRPGEDSTAKEKEQRLKKEEALRSMKERWATQPFLKLEKFNRDELYDD